MVLKSVRAPFWNEGKVYKLMIKCVFMDIELLKLKSELIYKKLIVLLAISGGSGAYAVRFYEYAEYGMALFFLVTFFVSALGVSINYQELNAIKKELDKEH